MRPKLLVTGGHGVLAGYVRRLMPHYQVIAPDKLELDITNDTAVTKLLNQEKPAVIIHAAALTDVDYCQSHPELADQVNARASGQLALAAEAIGAQFVYISTAAVFNGRSEFSVESDEPDPINHYGRSKLAGERLVAEFSPSALIVRSAWLIGGGREQRKFVANILRLAETQTELAVVNDKVGSLTYARDLVEFIDRSLPSRLSGIYHFASAGECSRYDIAECLVSTMQLPTRLVPVGSEFFAESFAAPRPDREVLRSIKHDFSIDWQTTLKQYIEDELR
ncbi:MAG: dTDP-4-dehydrorhamnose reductase [Candidatus Berkelbacteria bacterium Gr01-1014_85]|uniref:dTDP-4-dehydrorhamnose reductase n=1 Tax=Candidatus Berkelbacteria bacterium Gr01-1014_85 TaxID=2017150 RepID=A0A554JBZ4_9BACT|nr:MAG: dTDP-4-dehydrorhamnose reductase [Candidatus Berkelbacteria bacterium Gr01-1014_85]